MSHAKTILCRCEDVTLEEFRAAFAILPTVIRPPGEPLTFGQLADLDVPEFRPAAREEQ